MLPIFISVMSFTSFLISLRLLSYILLAFCFNCNSLQIKPYLPTFPNRQNLPCFRHHTFSLNMGTNTLLFIAIAAVCIAKENSMEFAVGAENPSASSDSVFHYSII